MYKSSVFLLLVFASILMPGVIVADEKIPFVIQLTRAADNYGHRRAFLQIDRVLDDLDEERLKFEVVAYEDGIHALLADNQETSQLLTKLANRGVTFKACRISMNAWRLTEDQFPLEVAFVAAGAP